MAIRANSRESSESGINEKIIVNRPVIIVEGFLIFHKPKSREMFDKKIFLELPDKEILKRRHARTRGTKHWDSRNYIQNKIIPYHHLYVEPQKAYADLVLKGSQDQHAIAEQVIDYINN